MDTVKLCRLCLTINQDDKFYLVENYISEILDNLFIKVNLGISDDPIICDKCAMNLQDFFDFKRKCLGTENTILSFKETHEKSTLKLREVYLHENKDFDKNDNSEQKVCRFCMKITKYEFTQLHDTKENIYITSILQKHVPELNLNITDKLIACNSCFDLLHRFYGFITKCTDVEEKIAKYIDSEVNDGSSHIQLNKVAEFTYNADAVRQKDIHDECKIEGNTFIKTKTEKLLEEDKADMGIKTEEVHLKTELSDNDRLFANISKTKFKMDAQYTIADRNEMLDSPSPTANDNINIISQEIVPPAIIENKAPSIAYVADDSQQNILIEDIGMDQVDDQHLLSAVDKNEILKIKEDIADIKADVVNIKQEICNMKQELKIQTTKINLNLDKIYQLLLARNYSENADVHQKNKVATEDLLQKYQFPLSSTEEISKVDEEICNNNEFKEQLVTALSRIGGTSGEEDGGKIAYKIIDFLFKSDVLINYSWTGVSRGKSGEKISFQILEGIVNVLFDVILLADNRHTRKKNVNILKDGVLKHAKKRSMRKSPDTAASPQCDTAMYKCQKCPFTTKRVCNLLQHKRIHQRPLPELICDLCPYKARFKSQMERHSWKHKDASEVKRFSCNLCSYRAWFQCQIRSHMITHQSQMPRIYKCDVCPYAAKLKRRLKVHMLVHKSPSEVTMFKCTECTFETKYKTCLQNHSITHKSSSDVALLDCHICFYKTKSKDALRKHMNKHLRVHRDPSKLITYKCANCAYETKNKQCLKQHLVTHCGSQSELKL